MSESEYLELLTLSVVLLPNLDSREYDVRHARARQMELFKKMAAPYSLYQEAEEIPTSET